VTVLLSNRLRKSSVWETVVLGEPSGRAESVPALTSRKTSTLLADAE
jgi:hypothetical protein